MDYYTSGLVGGTFGILLVTFWNLLKVTDQIERLNLKVEALLNQSGVDVTELANQKAAELLKSGDRIGAIKIYRQLTGVGVAEANATVEGFQEG